MVACLPLLLLPPLLLLLLATLGVGSPSFHSPPASQPRLFIERGLGRPQKPLDSFTLGPPVKELFGDFLETSPLLEIRTRSSPPHIDPYFRYFTHQLHKSLLQKNYRKLVSYSAQLKQIAIFATRLCQFPKSGHIYPRVLISSSPRHNVTVQQGARGRIFCRVYNLANRSISQQLKRALQVERH